MSFFDDSVSLKAKLCGTYNDQIKAEKKREIKQREWLEQLNDWKQPLNDKGIDDKTKQLLIRVFTVIGPDLEDE